MMRDLLFHVTILWLVLGALLIATSSLVASRDREDSQTVDLDDDATDIDLGESYGARSPRIILASDLLMQTDRSEPEGPQQNDVGPRSSERPKSQSFQTGSNRLAY